MSPNFVSRVFVESEASFKKLKIDPESSIDFLKQSMVYCLQ